MTDDRYFCEAYNYLVPRNGVQMNDPVDPLKIRYCLVDGDTGMTKFMHDCESLIQDKAKYWNAQMAKTREQIWAEHVVTHFSVGKRNTHHWDIYAAAPPYPDPRNSTRMGHGQDPKERAFCIRGEPGKIYIRDERELPVRDPFRDRDEKIFLTAWEALGWIGWKLMKEKSFVSP